MIYKRFFWQILLAILFICSAVLGLEFYLSKIAEVGPYSHILTFLGSGLAAWFMSWRLSRPVMRVRDHLIKMANGDLPENVGKIQTQVEEINQLVMAVDQIREQLRSRLETITLQKNEQDALFASMEEGVLAVDQRLHVFQINRAAYQILGLKPGELVGRSILEAIRLPQLIDLVQRGIESRDRLEGDIRIDGVHSKHIQVHVSPLHLDTKKSGIVMVFSDVTRIRELEGMRKNFVANVSHELRTPLTSIQGFAETLLNPNVKDPVEIKRFLEIIQRHASRLSRIIEDILTLSRIERDHENAQVDLSTNDVGDCIRNAVELCQVKAEKKKISLQVAIEKRLMSEIDPYLLEQAIINLIDNAIRYTDEGKVIVIKGEVVNSEVLVVVSDQGLGIPEKHFSRIFERFYRVDRARSRELGGTGLGLSIVKHIVNAHKGSIDVKSEVGKGSTFTIRLPKV